MNKPLQLFYNQISYKIWLIQFNVVYDIINIIKKLYFGVAMVRSLNPPDLKHYPAYDQLNLKRCFYINKEGVVYSFSAFPSNNPNTLITCVYMIHDDVFSISYEYQHYHLFVDFVKSEINHVETLSDVVPILNNHCKKYIGNIDIIGF